MSNDASADAGRGDESIEESEGSPSLVAGPHCDDLTNSVTSKGPRDAQGSSHDPGEPAIEVESEPETEPHETDALATRTVHGEIHQAAASSAFDARLSQARPTLIRQLCSAPKDYVSWLAQLRHLYGLRILLMLIAGQHICKGIAFQLKNATDMWLLFEYRVTGPRMQVLASVGNSAWALKPLVGICSDMFPVVGFHKAPYVIGASVVGLASTCIIGLTTKESIGVFGTVACLFGMSVQTATCDLLTEARISEYLHDKPAMGPDLVTFVWQGITVGNMIANSVIGMMISNLGARSVYLACIAPFGAIILPTLRNCLEEVPSSTEAVTLLREEFRRQRELLALALLMTAMTFVLIIVGVGRDSHQLQFWTACIILLILLPSFQLVLRPEIARVNTFWTLQQTLSVTIRGATFYFYTDNEEQYPEGPHFSAWFFTTVLGLVASTMSLIGFVTYTRYMKNWTYRSVTLLSNSLVTALSLLDIIMFRRWNLKLGIPDKLFIIGSSIGTVVIRQWQWIPGMVLTSHICPRGMEATIFALLAGCYHIGNQIADYLGAYMLDLLGCNPSGAKHESAQFQNLWIASCISTLLPAITVALIPVLVPNARQTDNILLHDASSATAGSWLSQMTGGGRAQGSGAGVLVSD